MNDEPTRVVITGGPGSGKTTIINQLNKRGYIVFEEISRQIIRLNLMNGSEALPWDNLMEFSRDVFSRRVIQYHAASQGINFYDRSAIDTLAYLPLDNLKPDPEMISWVNGHKYYPVVFILPPWKEIYDVDLERREDWNTAVRIYDLLYQTYQSLGYELLDVPHLTSEKRTDFILKNLGLI